MSSPPQPRPAAVARRPTTVVPWLACGAWLLAALACGGSRAADPVPTVDLLTIEELTVKEAATIRGRQAAKPALAGSSDAQFEAAFKAAGMSPEQIDRLWQDSATIPRVMAISVHPYITGTPHRIANFERLLDYVQSKAGVIIRTGEGIADWYKTQVPPPA